MESQFPDLSDEEPRITGTGAHWVLVFLLTQQPIAEGHTTPNGVVVDKAMIQGAELCAADIEAKLQPYYGDKWRSALIIEQRMHMPRVHESHNWGTPDVRAWAVLADGSFILWIWDYKYGFRSVEVFENEQLVNYFAGGVTEGQQRFPMFDETKLRVVLTVAQPRAYHGDGPVRTWDTTATILRPLVDRLAMGAEEATGVSPMCRPRPDVCQDCRARSGCEALQKAAYIGMDIAQRAVPRVLNDDALGLEMAMLADATALIKARMSGLEETVKARLKQGARVPYWAYGSGRGATVWTKPEAEIIAMGEMMGVKLAKPPEAITPIQAKAAGLDDSMLAVYSRSVTGATKLVRSDGADARRIFTAPP
jgi:hypothetical protein